MQVIIVGGGIAGLSAALSLHQIGIEIHPVWHPRRYSCLSECVPHAGTH